MFLILLGFYCHSLGSSLLWQWITSCIRNKNKELSPGETQIHVPFYIRKSGSQYQLLYHLGYKCINGIIGVQITLIKPLTTYVSDWLLMYLLFYILVISKGMCVCTHTRVCVFCFVLFFFLFIGVSTFVDYAKVTMVEEQQWYYLTHNWRG